MPLTDEQLMLQSQKGSLASFELLIQRWDKRMLNYFFRCVGVSVEAEDLRQELFLRIYVKRKSFKGNRPFSPWIYRIATNLVIDKVSRKRNPDMCPMEELTGSLSEACPDSLTTNSRSAAENGELSRIVREALRRIPGKERIALVMRHFENLNFKEIAEVLGAPESTIKTRVYRGLSALRKELKRMGVLDIDCLQRA